MNSADRTARFREIRDKVESEERLSLDDGIFLYDPAVPLQEIGALANLVRERKNGNVGYFNINTHLNPDQRLRLSVSVLCVSQRLARPQGIRVQRRPDYRAGPGSDRRRLHRNAHRRRTCITRNRTSGTGISSNC